MVTPSEGTISYEIEQDIENLERQVFVIEKLDINWSEFPASSLYWKTTAISQPGKNAWEIHLLKRDFNNTISDIPSLSSITEILNNLTEIQNPESNWYKLQEIDITNKSYNKYTAIFDKLETEQDVDIGKHTIVACYSAPSPDGEFSLIQPDVKFISNLDQYAIIDVAVGEMPNCDSSWQIFITDNMDFN